MCKVLSRKLFRLEQRRSRSKAAKDSPKTSDEEFGDNSNLEEEFKEEAADLDESPAQAEGDLSERVFCTADDPLTNMDSKVEIGLCCEILGQQG